MTLKPTQCALWLRARDPTRRRTFFFRGFNAVYGRWNHGTRVVRLMVNRSGRMALMALVLIGLAGWGLTWVPTGFIPTEDQGYVILSVHPDGASLARTQRVMARVSRIGLRPPAPLTRSRSARAGPRHSTRSVARQRRERLRDVQGLERAGKGQNIPDDLHNLRGRLAAVQERALGSSFRHRSRAWDFERLPDGGRADRRQLRLRSIAASDRETVRRPTVRRGSERIHDFRATVPQLTMRVNRTQAATLNVAVGDVYETLQIYLGSTS